MSEKRSTMGQLEKTDSEQKCNEMTHTVTIRLGTWLDTMYNRRGLFYALIVAVCWCFLDVVTKVLARSTHPLEIAFFRQTALVFVVTPCVVYRSDVIVKDSRYWRLLGLRGFFASVNTALRTAACIFLSIGNVSAIANTTPVFAGVLGWIILKERLTAKETVMSLVAVSGVILIAQPQFLFKSGSSENERYVGIIFAVGDAFTQALSIVFLRKLGGKSVHFLSAIAYYAVIGMFADCVLTTVLRSWTWPPCSPERLVMISFGPLVFGAQVCLAMACKLEKALYVSLILLTTICISIVLQFLLFKEFPNWISGIGTVLILFSALSLHILRGNTTQNLNQEEEQSEEAERSEKIAEVGCKTSL